jgi:hypothetical protein
MEFQSAGPRSDQLQSWRDECVVLLPALRSLWFLRLHLGGGMDQELREVIAPASLR